MNNILIDISYAIMGIIVLFIVMLILFAVFQPPYTEDDEDWW